MLWTREIVVVNEIQLWQDDGKWGLGGDEGQRLRVRWFPRRRVDEVMVAFGNQRAYERELPHDELITTLVGQSLTHRIHRRNHNR